MINIRQNICPADKWYIKCPYDMTPEFIVVHNTANDASAANEIAYMNRNNNYTSYHFAVDDKEIIQGLPLDRNGWHAGDGTYGAGNRKGIGIEICYSLSGGARFDQAEKNATWLIAKLLHERGWGLDRVKKHQDFMNKYCLPVNSTELLTKSGWVSLADVEVGDEVAQWDNGIIEFVKVENVVEPYTAEVVKARGIEATLDHDIICRSNSYDPWKKEKWKKVLNTPILLIPTSGKYCGAGLPISDDYLRFLVWVQADGHYAQRKSKYTGLTHQLGIEFHFSKKRKVQRLIEILNNIEQKYTCRERKDGTYVIRIFDCKKREELEQWLEDKMFSWKFLEMNEHQREVLFDEIILVDGSIRNNSYFTTKQQNYDVVSALAAIGGKRAYQTTTGNSTALIFSDSNFSISNNTTKEYRETVVSCVGVPSGNILIRQNGRNIVVGNCPHRTLDYGWQRFLDMVKTELDKLNAPKIPPKPEITYQPIPKKKVRLIRDTNLIDFSTGEAVKGYVVGEMIEVVAVASTKIGQFYMTNYSYNGSKIRATKGFRLTDCEDEKIISQTPKPEPKKEPKDTEVLDIAKENNQLLKQILELIKAVFEKIKGVFR